MISSARVSFDIRIGKLATEREFCYGDNNFFDRWILLLELLGLDPTVGRLLSR